MAVLADPILACQGCLSACPWKDNYPPQKSPETPDQREIRRSVTKLFPPLPGSSSDRSAFRRLEEKALGGESGADRKTLQGDSGSQQGPCPSLVFHVTL